MGNSALPGGDQNNDQSGSPTARKIGTSDRSIGRRNPSDNPGPQRSSSRRTAGALWEVGVKIHRRMITLLSAESRLRWGFPAETTRGSPTRHPRNWADGASDRWSVVGLLFDAPRRWHMAQASIAVRRRSASPRISAA